MLCFPVWLKLVFLCCLKVLVAVGPLLVHSDSLPFISPPHLHAATVPTCCNSQCAACTNATPH